MDYWLFCLVVDVSSSLFYANLLTFWPTNCLANESKPFRKRDSIKYPKRKGVKMDTTYTPLERRTQRVNRCKGRFALDAATWWMLNLFPLAEKNDVRPIFGPRTLIIIIIIIHGTFAIDFGTTDDDDDNDDREIIKNSHENTSKVWFMRSRLYEWLHRPFTQFGE